MSTKSKKDITSDTHVSRKNSGKRDNDSTLKTKTVNKKNDDVREKKSQTILLKSNIIGIDNSSANLP